MYRRSLWLVLVALRSFQSCAACPETREEQDVKSYVARRAKLVEDGSLAAQIRAGTYTADSLSLEMYEWWVQLGLSNHGTAIDNFVAMVEESGMPHQQPPSKDWSPLVNDWVFVMMSVIDSVSPVLSSLAGIVHVGMLTYQTAALACADPSQGGSSEFLAAAQKWRAELPSRETSHLLMIHDFINDLKTNNTAARLLPAYEFVTKLIDATQSYRLLFNGYYVAYLQASVPNQEFFVAAMVRKGSWPWEKPEVTLRAIWPAAPPGLDSCTLEKRVLQANDGCVDQSTPMLKRFATRALVINVAYDSTGYQTWQGLAYPCDDIDNNATAWCIDGFGFSHSPTDMNEYGRVCSNWRHAMDIQTDVFNKLRGACSTSFTATAPTLTYNYMKMSGNTRKGDYWPLAELRSKKDLEKRTCQTEVIV
eukprot:TRINITY_DN24903_c0_g1_i1.p1 TRINITY_DN24903_c0_g1~~TRINITY_DN24903_c0_g1_i1.p1  ORF type:complete len:420 (+),score=58.52 TRINITY_DN24903_c0_g1_i1:58-1317(+)